MAVYDIIPLRGLYSVGACGWGIHNYIPYTPRVLMIIREIGPIGRGLGHRGLGTAFAFRYIGYDTQTLHAENDQKFILLLG